MISLSSLVSLKTTKPKKRIGRGGGSGKGFHTVGRGNKGQKAREKVPLLFGGTKGKKSWLQRLPLWRGKGKREKKKQLQVIKLSVLDKLFASNEEVTSSRLAQKLGVKEKRFKILSSGEISKPLLVKVPCSKQAAEKIKKAGGRVEKEE